MMMRASAVTVWRRGARKRITRRSQSWAGWQKRMILTQFFLFGVLVISGVALVFLYLSQSWQSTYLSTQISKSREELDNVYKEISELESDVSGAFTVERIRKLASEELGMVEPQIEVLTLPPLPK